MAVGITVLHLKALLWSCLPLEESAQDCSLAEDLACAQITPACYGRQGNDTTVFCEGKIQVGASTLPLICWQGPEDGNKRSSCYGPKRKKLSLQRQPTRPLWTYINKAVLSLEKVILVVVKPTTTSDDPSLRKVSIGTTSYAGNPVVANSLLLSTETLCFYFQSLFYRPTSLAHLPKQLGFVIKWSG